MKKPKIKIKAVVINDHAWINDTWLSPYSGYPATLLIYKNGRKDLVLDGLVHSNVDGSYTSENGWQYEIEKLLNRPFQGKFA